MSKNIQTFKISEFEENLRVYKFFQDHQKKIYKSTDRMFAILMPLQWLLAIVLAVLIAPLTWNGSETKINPHVWAAIIIGGLITLLPLFLALKYSGKAFTRYTISACQILMSSLLIYVTNGQIETHFHIFGSLAFLAFYRDWRVLIPATIITTVDHALRGWFFPQSIYGALTSTEWRVLEHAAWVIFEDIFLIILCHRSINEMRESAVRTAALDDNETRYRAVVEQTTEGIFLLEPNTLRVIESNEAFANLIGYENAEEVKTLSAIDFDPVNSEELEFIANLLREDKGSLNAERKYLRKDGSFVHVEIVGRSITFGETIAFCVNARDISKRKRAESEVKRLALVAKKIRNAVLITNTNFEIEWVNESFTTISGFEFDEVIGKNPTDFLTGIETSKKTIDEIIECINQQKEFTGEIYHYNKAGSGYWVSLSIVPIHSENGRLLGYIKVQEDITQRKAMENALKQSHDDLENRVVSRTGELLEIVEAMQIEVAERKLVEEALHEKEAKFRDLFDNAPVAYHEIDTEGRYTRINHTEELLLGYTSEELKGRHPSEIIVEKVSREAIAAKLAGKMQLHAVERTFIRKDGTLVSVLNEDRLIHDADGKVTGIRSTLQDITERKQIEERQSAILNSLPAHICLLDQSGKILEVNNEWKQFALANGYSGNNFGVGSNYLEICGMATGDFTFGARKAEENCRKVLSGESTHFEMEYPCHSPHEKRWFKLTVNPLNKEKSSGAVVMHINVTERKRIEEELSEAKNFLDRVIDNVPNLIFVKDETGRYIIANQAFALLHGVKLKDVIGKTDAELIKNPKDVESETATDKQVIENNQEFVNHEEKFVDSNGATHWLQTIKRPMPGKMGVKYIVGIATDLTERKNLESQLHNAQKLESIGQLAAGIAHEINTPTQYVGDNTKFLRDGFEAIATVLRKYDELLAAARCNEITADLITQVEDEIKTSDLKYFVEEVPNAVRQSLEGISRIAKIVQSMKDFAHPGSKEKSFVNLNKAIESTITVARNEWKYVADLETNFDVNLPDVPCLLGEFNQVILNMVINASHAIADVVGNSNGKGKITISTTKVNDDWAEIRIADTGSGIPIEAQNHVFDPFFTTKEVGKGTGQGLAISHTVVVEKHKGKLHFETECGTGTTFIIQLPLKITNSENKGLQP